MTNEEKFISNLEVYLGYKLDEYGVKRVLGYLNEYRLNIPPFILKGKSERAVKIVNPSLPIPSAEDIIYEAKKICLKYEIDYSAFLNRGRRKTTSTIAEIRKEFCREMMTNYNIRRKQLEEYFRVDHATIIYYLQGKRYIRKTKIKQAS